MSKDDLFGDSELFGDIEVHGDDRRFPLGGIHRQVFEDTGKPLADGFAHKESAKKLWNADRGRGDKGWVTQITKQASLDDITTTIRTERPVEEIIVSRSVDGVWYTGASDHLRDEVIELLEKNGYVRSDDREMRFQRIETFRLA